ncbi:hypothetical protein PSV09DRAFT_2260223 [Bipolaris maydis]|uniref:uncharacterized protein n=1 Tax=Cochliobolus heterostrophus TaxID=5016 RepID=UPI0024D4ECCB|nr:hypothetical protein J3E74DRAFT_292844 [Bipolaris maydis]KAJ6206867.1 hypothetical protein PSV09DRAFT_2260223 [Bipolaris maydis]KAJ6268611.1 hypothetical protein PSV08DRAFT_249927 [Bipolaris maydis]KAJ6278856.1 hypothetical protein J3E71DRAFT_243852 [Bipolaris maydis]
MGQRLRPARGSSRLCGVHVHTGTQSEAVRLHALGLHLRNGAPADYSLKRQKSPGHSYRLFEMSSHNWWIQRATPLPARGTAKPRSARASCDQNHWTCACHVAIGPSPSTKGVPGVQAQLQMGGMPTRTWLGRGRGCRARQGGRTREGCEGEGSVRVHVRDGERESGTTVGDRLEGRGAGGHAHAKGVARSKPRARNPARHTVNGRR